jgi:hypothetical protein
MEVSCKLHDPAALPPRKEPLVSIVKEARWAGGADVEQWLREQYLPLLGIKP